MSRQNTRQRLLDAARGLFAERGYHNATVRDIALRAGTNIASINYYFRSKDVLYQEVIRNTFDQGRSDNISSNSGDQLPDGTPRERLKAFIRHLIPLSTDELGDEEHRRLMAWEVLAPTGAVEAVDEWEIVTHLDVAQTVVRPFLPADATDNEVLRTGLWLIGQCLVFRKLAAAGKEGSAFTGSAQAYGEELAELVMTRALSGLDAS